VIERLMALFGRRRVAVLVGAALAAVAGFVARGALVEDAVPDIVDPRIALSAEWMGHAAPEVAAKVTQLLTSAIDGTPGATAVRGTSMTGMAFVDVVFADARDPERGRELIQARVDGVRARLPSGARVRVGPAASAAGWVFEYALVDARHTRPLAELRGLQEAVLRPALAALPGVAEIASIGGARTEIVVEADPSRLAAAGLTLTDVAAALRAGDPAALGADDASKRIEALAVPPEAPARATPLATPQSGDGWAARLQDVARVHAIPEMPSGAADDGGRGLPVVGGVVVAKPGADVTRLIDGVKQAVAGIRARLPPGVQVHEVYDRSELSKRIGGTLARALAEEIAAVIAVILLFLLHPRSAALPLATLPLVLALTFAAMWLLGVTATVMSLGGIGIALGMAVDADVVALEACARKLEAAPPDLPAAERRARLAAATASVAPAILTSLLIAACAFLPVLAFSGETGRLLRPLAVTKTLVIGAAAVVAVVVSPVLRNVLLGGRVPPESANPITRRLVAWYGPFVRFALDRPRLTLATGALAVLSALPLLPRLGGEFFPRLDEGDLLYMPTTRPGVMLDEAFDELVAQDRSLGSFGEVASVFGKVGRADTPTDPAPPSMIETTIRLKPRDEWPPRARRRWYTGRVSPRLARVLRWFWPDEGRWTTSELVDNLGRAVRAPGWVDAWTAPARARMDMMSTGVRTPVGVRIVAADLDRFEPLGAAVRAIVERVPGTRAALCDALGGETALVLEPDAGALAQLHAGRDLVLAGADLVLTGGEIAPPPTRTADRGANDPPRLRLTLASAVPRSDARLRAATIRIPGSGSGAVVPLGLLGRARFVSRPAMVRSERGESVAYVYVDLEDGTNVGPGERIEWTGQYELLSAGQRRMKVILPLAALGMLALLVLQFRSLTGALIVATSVPFALVGSVWTLFLAGFSMSAPVWVGLLSVIGLAMQTAVVMVVYIDQAFHARLREGRIRCRDDIVAAHAEGSVRRLRPKLMTVATMAAGLLPLLWADGAGAEIMKRIAAPMIGGLLTSAFLTLEIMPVVYTVWRDRQLREAGRRGCPLSDVVGPAPPWARV
jgi:Cu(I)/Ag(I) efflux system membrane protein CusA/SilA